MTIFSKNIKDGDVIECANINRKHIVLSKVFGGYDIVVTYYDSFASNTIFTSKSLAPAKKFFEKIVESEKSAA